MTPSQCRAARALLGISQTQLADASGVAKRTIVSFEKEDRTPLGSKRAALRSALEEAGVMFLNDDGHGPGVRFKASE